MSSPESDSVGTFSGTFRKLAALGVIVAIIWLLFQWTWVSFPYIRNGTRCIIDAKRYRMVPSPMFAETPAGVARLLVFGDSRALCSFIPDQFDRLAGGKVSSFNLGLPGEKEFMPLLEGAIRAGNIPTHVFLFVSWKDKDFHPTIWHWVESDRYLADLFFPFRTLPRDAVSFLLDSRHHGGVRAFYDYTRSTVEQMIRDRGFHFISGSSEFPDDTIPDDYTIWNDDTKYVETRDVVAAGQRFERIRELADKHDFNVYFVPGFARSNSRAAPPPMNKETVAALAPYPRFHVLGPDYVLYPNRYFSDPVHLNRVGADVHTRYLWDITRHVLEQKK